MLAADGTQISNGYICVGAYHVVSNADGSRITDVCQTSPRVTSSRQEVIPVGQLTSAGVACIDYAAGYGVARWDGHVDVYARLTNERSFACGVSLNAERIACSGSTGAYVAAAIVIDARGNVVSLGRRYSILGWMDNDCMLVSVDCDTLAVVAADGSGMHLTVPFHNADQVAMVGVISPA